MNSLIKIINPNSVYSPLFQSKNFFKLKKRKNILLSLLYITGAIFYLLSLRHLNESNMQCFNKTGAECYYILCILGFIASFLTIISLYLILFFNFKKIHLSIIAIIYLFFYFIDHNFGVEKHGLLNYYSIYFFIFIYIISSFNTFFGKKRRFIIMIILISPFLILYIYFKIYKSTHFSCVGWENGLNDTYIDNSSKDYPCSIEIPHQHKCYLGELGPYADFVKIFKQNCQDPNLILFEKQKFLNDLKNLKYSKKSKKIHFGYPITNKGGFNGDKFGTITDPGKKSFEDKVNEEVILMDLFKENKNLYYPNISKPEIEVILDDKGGKILINIEKMKL